MPFNPRFTITNPIADALTRIERARGFLEAAKLSEDWVSRMQQRGLVREVGTGPKDPTKYYEPAL